MTASPLVLGVAECLPVVCVPHIDIVATCPAEASMDTDAASSSSNDPTTELISARTL